MSKRLQVVLNDAEMGEIQRIARDQRITVSEWVRQVLRAARRQSPAKDARRKIEVVRAAARHTYPSGDIDRMLAEIERGYLGSGGS